MSEELRVFEKEESVFWRSFHTCFREPIMILMDNREQFALIL